LSHSGHRGCAVWSYRESCPPRQRGA
jgi:hypothetical protein